MKNNEFRFSVWVLDGVPREMIRFRDGDATCYVLPDFIDLQNSPAVFVKDGDEYNLKEIYKQLKNNTLS